MVREKYFYKQFFTMWIVLVLQNVITLSVNLADNIMLGGYREAALSGVTAVNQVQFLYQQLLTALGEGVVILGSQYFGRRDYEPMRRISAAAMHIALVICLLLFSVMSLIPQRVLMIFTDDAAIIAEGVRYTAIIRFSYLFFCLTQILLATLRSTGTVRIALGLSVMSLIINVCINYTLIYGHFGAPEMGTAGAAIGTLTARITEFTVLLLYILKKRVLSLRFRDYLKHDGLLFRDYIRVTLPVFIVQGLWGLSTAAQNAILGHMTARAIAANSVASTLYSLTKSLPIGACSTASFLIGRTIGEGNQKKLTLYSRTLQILFVLIGIFVSVTLFCIRIPILSLYRLEPETLKMANTFLLILSAISLTMSYQMPVNNGIVRGGGDTSFTMKLDLVSVWCIVLPLSYVMAFIVHASPVVVVICLNADQVFKCVPAFIKVNYGHWAKKLTR